jgi:hypothetical protein
VNNLISGTIQGYWAVDINDANDANTATFGHVDDVNAVIFNTKDKVFKVIIGSVFADPCDPCKVVDMSYVTSDAKGDMFLNVLGKGKPTKIYDANRADANTLVKKFVPASMNGTGGVNSFDTFDADRLEFFTGVGTISLTLDATLTKHYNSAGFTVDQAINDILSTKLKKLTTRIPYTFQEMD